MKKLTENDKFVNSIIKKAGLLILIEAILLIFLDNRITLILGLLFGGIISILFFRITYVNIQYIINKTERQAKRIMIINYTVRYFISGLVLFVCAKSSNFNIFTCFLGLLTIKLTFYINNVISLVSRKEEKKSF